MARKRTRIPLNVYLNSRLVGRLQRETSGAIDFQYDESWLNWEHAFPVSLSLPLREDRYVGDPVIAVFDNLLPDNEDIRRRVAARSDADGIDPYSLLAAIGRDCVGALQFLPDGKDPGKAGELNARQTSDAEIADRLANLANAPLGIGDDAEFRISIAGAQDKTALLYWKDAWHVPHGSTATTHILKPQIGQRGNYDLSRSVENEHMCLEILRALDLPVAKTQIVDFAGTCALVIERFDREWTKGGRLLRVPQEDCCQALSVPPSDDPAYDHLVFLKAQIAFWLLGAIDGHAKNFSIFLYPGGGFQLAPLYDVMSAQNLQDKKQIQRKEMKLAMSVGNSRHYHIHQIQPRHYRQTADRAGLPDGMADMALDQIADALPGAIEIVCAALPSGFPADVRDSIASGALQRRNVIATAAA
jgi:serine/threonine-protein kinase HipA